MVTVSWDTNNNPPPPPPPLSDLSDLNSLYGAQYSSRNCDGENEPLNLLTAWVPEDLYTSPVGFQQSLDALAPPKQFQPVFDIPELFKITPRLSSDEEEEHSGIIPIDLSSPYNVNKKCPPNQANILAHGLVFPKRPQKKSEQLIDFSVFTRRKVLPGSLTWSREHLVILENVLLAISTSGSELKATSCIPIFAITKVGVPKYGGSRVKGFKHNIADEATLALVYSTSTVNKAPLTRGLVDEWDFIDLNNGKDIENYLKNDIAKELNQDENDTELIRSIITSTLPNNTNHKVNSNQDYSYQTPLTQKDILQSNNMSDNQFSTFAGTLNRIDSTDYTIINSPNPFKAHLEIEKNTKSVFIKNYLSKNLCRTKKLTCTDTNVTSNFFLAGSGYTSCVNHNISYGQGVRNMHRNDHRPYNKPSNNLNTAYHYRDISPHIHYPPHINKQNLNLNHHSNQNCNSHIPNGQKVLEKDSFSMINYGHERPSSQSNHRGGSASKIIRSFTHAPSYIKSRVPRHGHMFYSHKTNKSEPVRNESSTGSKISYQRPSLDNNLRYSKSYEQNNLCKIAAPQGIHQSSNINSRSNVYSRNSSVENRNIESKASTFHEYKYDYSYKPWQARNITQPPSSINESINRIDFRHPNQLVYHRNSQSEYSPNRQKMYSNLEQERDKISCHNNSISYDTINKRHNNQNSQIGNLVREYNIPQYVNHGDIPRLNTVSRSNGDFQITPIEVSRHPYRNVVQEDRKHNGSKPYSYKTESTFQNQSIYQGEFRELTEKPRSSYVSNGSNRIIVEAISEIYPNAYQIEKKDIALSPIEINVKNNWCVPMRNEKAQVNQYKQSSIQGRNLNSIYDQKDNAAYNKVNYKIDNIYPENQVYKEYEENDKQSISSISNIRSPKEIPLVRSSFIARESFHVLSTSSDSSSSTLTKSNEKQSNVILNLNDTKTRTVYKQECKYPWSPTPSRQRKSIDSQDELLLKLQCQENLNIFKIDSQSIDDNQQMNNNDINSHSSNFYMTNEHKDSNLPFSIISDDSSLINSLSTLNNPNLIEQSAVNIRCNNILATSKSRWKRFIERWKTTLQQCRSKSNSRRCSRTTSTTNKSDKIFVEPANLQLTNQIHQNKQPLKSRLPVKYPWIDSIYLESEESSARVKTERLAYLSSPPCLYEDSVKKDKIAQEFIPNISPPYEMPKNLKISNILNEEKYDKTKSDKKTNQLQNKNDKFKTKIYHVKNKCFKNTNRSSSSSSSESERSSVNMVIDTTSNFTKESLYSILPIREKMYNHEAEEEKYIYSTEQAILDCEYVGDSKTGQPDSPKITKCNTAISPFKMKVDKMKGHLKKSDTTNRNTISHDSNEYNKKNKIPNIINQAKLNSTNVKNKAEIKYKKINFDAISPIKDKYRSGLVQLRKNNSKVSESNKNDTLLAEQCKKLKKDLKSTSTTTAVNVKPSKFNNIRRTASNCATKRK